MKEIGKKERGRKKRRGRRRRNRPVGPKQQQSDTSSPSNTRLNTRSPTLVTASPASESITSLRVHESLSTMAPNSQSQVPVAQPRIPVVQPVQVFPGLPPMSQSIQPVRAFVPVTIQPITNQSVQPVTQSTQPVQPIQQIYLPVPVAPMPIPSQPRAPLFAGKDVTEFLRAYDSIAKDHKVSAKVK